MSAKFSKALAVLLLALAIGAVAVALQASSQRVSIQGPSAVAALPDGSVWLSVDDALWRFDANGRRVAVVPRQVHGVDGLIANLVAHPNGQLVASMRDDPDLHFLDPVTGSPRSRLRPRWPADLERHADRAITYAFDEDGRVAIATGGGHAVALFDAHGAFLGRTAPQTYEFTNGLWWSGESLWTTDTNRFALVELDGRTLAVKRRIALPSSGDGRAYLGMAAGWPTALPTGGARAGAAPLGTVVRFGGDMVEGSVVDVFASGQQRAWPTAHPFEPRDVKWRGGELLVVDGASFAVKRFSPAGGQLTDFGDAAARTELSAALLRRDGLQARYAAGLIAAAAFFLAGLVFALKAQAMDKAARLAALQVDLSQLGTQPLAARERARLMLAMMWPLLLAVAAGFAFTAALQRPGSWGFRVRTPALVGMSALYLASLIATAIQVRRIRRRASDPAVDALLNQRAINALATTDAFWRVRDPGEVPRETLMLQLGRDGTQWLVLTNQRLLVFAATLRDAVLKKSAARRDVLRAAVLGGEAMTLRERLTAALGGGALLRIEFRDGSIVEGAAAATQTARRLADLLRGNGAAEAPSTAHLRRAAQAAPGYVPDERSAQAQALASLLVPGLGQWLQGRSGTALLMFLPWLVMVLAVGLPLVWALWGPRTAVPALFAWEAAAAYGVLCVAAAFDAWRMRARVA